MADILDAFAAGHRPELPQARGPSSAALRELTRIGNNLNQIAHRANLMRLRLIQADARKALAAVLAAVRRL
ncbi:MAG TPA: plasmid mobilization relaxosome protein MobC [Hyphomicrobiaceae bacterium]|nr:plasmid mobilization relaxosome protein MobC [Hyphomicrobiaceae bacterium]